LIAYDTYDGSGESTLPVPTRRHPEGRKLASVFFSLRVGPRDLVLEDNNHYVVVKETLTQAFLRASVSGVPDEPVVGSVGWVSPWWVFS
jgi:hypothetical protein